MYTGTCDVYKRMQLEQSECLKDIATNVLLGGMSLRNCILS